MPTQQTIAVTASGLPVITAPSTATVALNQATKITGVSLSENGSTSDESFTVTLSDGHGKLSATTSAEGGGGSISGSGTTSLTITGSLSQVNADLATLSDTDPSSGFGHDHADGDGQLQQQCPAADDCGDGERAAGDYGAVDGDGCAQSGDEDHRGEPVGERQHQ